MKCFNRLRFLVLQVFFAAWNIQDGLAILRTTTDLDEIGIIGDLADIAIPPPLDYLRLSTPDAYQLPLIGMDFDARGPKAGTTFDYNLQKERPVTAWTGLGANMKCFDRLRLLVLQHSSMELSTRVACHGIIQQCVFFQTYEERLYLIF
ncbi:hypothetical protein ISCGN_023147 [Ixodes scapularis]